MDDINRTKTEFDNILVQNGWYPVGFSLWAHPSDYKFKNEFCYTTECALAKNEQIGEYNLTTTEILLAEVTRLKEEIRNLRSQLNQQERQTND